MTQTARPVDVLIVDDQESFLDAMAALIGVMSGFRVVGVATSGRQALERVQQQPVDLVLLDVHLGEESGIEIGVAMQALAHRPAVVLMSAYRREELGLDIQLVGAPFIAKDELSPTRLRNTWCVLRSARESDPD